MSSSTTSPTLLSRVRNPADKVAWREFDARYGEMIVRYGRRRGLQHADAEDIRQIVMVRLSKALLAFNYSPIRGKFRSFVGRIVRNEVIRLLSRPNITSRRVDSDGGESREPVNEEKLDRQWEREWADHHLRLAVGRLRRTYEPRSIDVFEQLLAGETVERVAADFNMTTQAVHKVKQRIRNRLKEIIAGQIREEDQPNG
ncbi:MAG: sigma-70 family RNA polymerase sigma factor [Phycisphaerales bacterium]